MSRILLVEDSADVLFVLQTELEWMGYTVDAANGAEAAIQMAVQNKPDVIVSDLQMPGVDGYEFMRRIRQMPEFDNIPAIALTGWSMSKEVSAAIDCGFTACFTKPVDGQQLSEAIMRLIGKCLRKAS